MLVKKIDIDDQVAAVLDAAAKISGFGGLNRYNIVLRRLLDLPGDQAGPADQSVYFEADSSSAGRAFGIDEMVLDVTLKGAKPRRWVGPKGETKEIEHWAEFVACAAEWLITTGLVATDQPPIAGYRKHPLLSQSRQKLGHPDPARRVGDGWWVETWGNINTKARNLRRLVLAVGFDPRGFRAIVPVSRTSDGGPK